MKNIKKISFLLIIATLFANTNSIRADKKKNSIGISTAQTVVGKNNIFIFPKEFQLDQLGISYEYYMNNSFSLGLEYNTFFNKKVEDLKFKDYNWKTFNTNIVLNYYTNNGYTFSKDAVITPYFSLGLAYYRVHKDNTNPNFSSFANNTLSGLGRVGLNFQWSKYVSTQVYLQRARVIPYYNADDKKFISPENSLHTIGATVKFHFGGGNSQNDDFNPPVIYTSGDFNQEPTLDEYATQHSAVEKTNTTLNNDSLVVNDNLITNDTTISEKPITRDTVEIIKEVVTPRKDTPRKIKIYNNNGKLKIYIDKGRALDIEIDNGAPSTIVPVKKDTVKKVKSNQVPIVKPLVKRDTIQMVDTIHQVDTVTIVKPIRQIVRDTVWVKEPVVEKDTIYINNAPVIEKPVRQEVRTENKDTVVMVKEVHHYKDEIKKTVRPTQKDTIFVVKEINNNTKEIHHYRDSVSKKVNQEGKSNLPKVESAKKDTLIINNIIRPATQQPTIKEIRDTVRLVKRDTVKVIKKDTITIKEKAEIPKDKVWSIYFKNGQDKLTSENKNDLAHFIGTLEKSSVIFIEGYTDKSGSAKLNEKISKIRAESVKKYLITVGISADKMWVKAYGEKFATKENDPQERLVLIRAKQ